jgi:Tfp pilus assembly protein PilO
MSNPTRGFGSLIRSEQLLHLGFATLAFLVIAGTYSMRCAVAEKIESIAYDIEDCESLCDLEKELTESITQAELRKKELETEYASLLARIPKRVLDSDVLASLRQSANATSCSLIDFRPSLTQQKNDFHTRSYNLQMEGKFVDLLRFLDSLRSAPFVFQTSRLKVSESNIPGGPCHVDLELNIVFDHAWTQSE